MDNIKPTNLLVGHVVTFYVIGMKTSGRIVEVHPDEQVYVILVDGSGYYRVAPNDIVNIAELMKSVGAYQDSTAIPVEKTGPNWYENRDPATAKRGFDPNVTTYATSPLANEGSNRVAFGIELAKVLNRNSVDAELNTPDYILAQYVIDSLNAFKSAQDVNVEWHGAQEKMRMQ